MDILICGAGIAGPNLAWWLARDGHRVTLVEKSPKLRAGGYIIDFWGKGYDLADRMGLLPGAERAGYHVKNVDFVGDDGRRRGGFPVSALEYATHGRFVSLPRSALSRLIFEALPTDVERIFGDEVTVLEQDARGVSVELRHGGTRRFDLVIGAEGIHSPIREMVFGPESAFEHFLGYGFAAFVIDGYPVRSPDAYVMYGEPGREAARFTLRDNSTMVMMIWRDEVGAPIPHDAAGQKAFLRERFAGAKWEVPQFLSALDHVDDLYVDRVSQIRLDRWHDGRIGLVGDAAHAPSFLAGQGSALAMIGGYVLAAELKRAPGDPETAFRRYEARLARFMRKKQDAATKMATSFVPRTEFGLSFRAAVSRVLGVEWIANLFIGRGIRDDLDLDPKE